jgi:hypothetical protein
VGVSRARTGAGWGSVCTPLGGESADKTGPVVCRARKQRPIFYRAPVKNTDVGPMVQYSSSTPRGRASCSRVMIRRHEEPVCGYGRARSVCR